MKGGQRERKEKTINEPNISNKHKTNKDQEVKMVKIIEISEMNVEVQNKYLKQRMNEWMNERKQQPPSTIQQLK